MSLPRDALRVSSGRSFGYSDPDNDNRQDSGIPYAMTGFDQRPVELPVTTVTCCPSDVLRRGSMMRSRLLGVVIGVLALGAAACGSHPGGDPGGGILRSLEGIRDAIPSGATGLGMTTEEAQWISGCDDEYFHKGWGMIGVTITFDSHLSEKKVFAQASQWMQENGWHAAGQSTVGPTAIRWSRHLRQGTTARAFVQYSPEPPGPTWSMNATSPPEPPVGECAGG